MTRQFTSSDQIIDAFDSLLRNLSGVSSTLTDNMASSLADVDYPSSPSEEGLPTEHLTATEAKHSAALMRVNHVGEVCAQALYAGQAATASDPSVAESMRDAAAEELQHLRWCERRIDELGGRKSLLNPVWAGGSLIMGMVAGIAGDKKSLGFIEETEAQVCAHLDRHLTELSERDTTSREIVRKMRADEAGHQALAQAMGAEPLPQAVKLIMKLQAKIMTTIAYRI